MKKWVITAVAACVAAIVVVKSWWFLSIFIVGPYKGQQFETWQTQNNNFRIRVEAFHEANGGFVPGAYYTFSSAPVGSEDWKEIMTFRHDDSIEIRKQNVRFVSDDIAFVFMGWMFATTNDGGKTWHTWDGCKPSSALKVCNYEGIKAVDLSPGGQGTMTLVPIPAPTPLPIIRTEDFGRTWHE